MEHIDQEADAVMRGPRSLFDRLAGGEDTLVAALFRNDIVVEGDLGLVDLLARLFPGPTSAHHPREFARRGNPDA